MALRPRNGSTARLKELSDSLKSLGNGVVDEGYREVKPVLDGLISEQFGGANDPWGSGWTPAASNPSSPLVLTGALANPRITRGRISLEKYWKFMQIGANNAAANAIVPPKHGSNWDDPIEKALESVVERRLPK